MNKHATVTVHGNAGPERRRELHDVRPRAHPRLRPPLPPALPPTEGLLVIDGDASLRCGISLKGADIVVGGSVGSFSAFMAQAGRMVICGDAEDALGDSLIQKRSFMFRGKVRSLGADARFRANGGHQSSHPALKNLLALAGLAHDPADFKRVASAKSLYHWHADANQEY